MVWYAFVMKTATKRANYHTNGVIKTDVDSALLLAEAIVERLRKDARSHNIECETTDGHKTFVCARDIWSQIQRWIQEQSPPPDAVEIASEVLRLHTWQP